MKITPLLLLVLVFTIQAQGAALSDKIQAFNDALKTASPAGAMPFGRVMSVLDPESYPGGESALESTVQQIMSSNPSPVVQKAGAALLAALGEERKVHANAVTAKVDAMLSKVPAVVAKAQKPADLDDILGEIQAALPANSPYGYGGNTDIQEEMNRVNNTYQFVSQWQDYLSQSASGNKQAALTTLRSLSQQRPSGPPIVPRSDILQRIATLESEAQAAAVSPVNRPSEPQPSKIDPIIAGIHSLDDLEPAAERAQMSSNNNGYTNNDNLCIGVLGRMADAYSRAKSGLPFSIDFKPQNYMQDIIPPQFVPIETMLFDYLLPRLFKMDAPPRNSGESIDAYLDRLTTVAEAAQNVALLGHVTLARYQIAGADYTQNPKAFLTALNLDEAGQYTLALESYATAVRQPNRFVPVDFIGSRLATLKKDHPGEYATGMEKVLNPPAPVYNVGAGYPQMNPYTRQQMMPPGFSPTGTQPGATPTTNAAPPSTPAPPPSTSAPHSASTPAATVPSPTAKPTSPAKPTTD